MHQITRDSIYHDEASGYDVEGDPWGAYEEYWYDALTVSGAANELAARYLEHGIVPERF